MIVYRIAKTKYINDLSGNGARLYGGRWNHKGVGIIYTSETRALATVEYLVHVPLSIVPEGLSIASIEVPDDVAAREILTSELPGNWRSYPPPIELAELGTRWVLSNETLLFRVPSVVIKFWSVHNPDEPEPKSFKS